MLITETKILCDRCGECMETAYGKKWELYKQKKKWVVLKHEVPCWDRTDTFCFCDKCTDSFKEWMEAR